jgi:2-iminobutanoate/2-iminopropanoate deaminase
MLVWNSVSLWCKECIFREWRTHEKIVCVRASRVKGTYSPASSPKVAGRTGAVDNAGNSLAGDFDAQCLQPFRNIEKTIADAGAKLSDIVTMTVFLIDVCYTTRIGEARTEIFGKDFPASAAIVVAGFVQPEMMIEVQCVAAA